MKSRTVISVIVVIIILFLARSIYSDYNTKYGDLWPNITKKRAEDVPQDQEKWRGVKDKLKYFSEKPGKGD